MLMARLGWSSEAEMEAARANSRSLASSNTRIRLLTRAMIAFLRSRTRSAPEKSKSDRLKRSSRFGRRIGLRGKSASASSARLILSRLLWPSTLTSPTKSTFKRTLASTCRLSGRKPRKSLGFDQKEVRDVPRPDVP